MKRTPLFTLVLTILSVALFTTTAHAQSGSSQKAGSQEMAGSGSTMTHPHHSSRLEKIDSQQSFDKTYSSLKSAIESKDLKIIAEIDHAKNAESADMTLPPTKVILFGNPKMGTPLMQADQDIAIDLPQRMVVYEDAQGGVHIVYNDAQAIAKEHKITGKDEIIGKMSKALMGLAKAAASGNAQ